MSDEKRKRVFSLFNKSNPAERFLDWFLDQVLPWFLAGSILLLGFGAVCGLIFFIGMILFPAAPSQRPTMDAPLLEIVRYCESLARDQRSGFNGKTPTTQYVDNPDKFLSCLREYEYEVSR